MIAVDGLVRDTLAEAATWRLLGLLFERPRAGWHAEVAALAAELTAEDVRAAAAAAADADEGAYLALVGPGGAVSPRAVGHRGVEDPGAVLADLSAFYEAFAFHPAGEDPPDHIAVQAGFLGWLKLKEAYARAAGEDEAAAVAAGAAARFTEAHPRRMAGAFAERLERVGDGWLALAARALAARTGVVEAGPVTPDDGETLVCGGACGGGGQAD